MTKTLLRAACALALATACSRRRAPPPERAPVATRDASVRAAPAGPRPLTRLQPTRTVEVPQTLEGVDALGGVAVLHGQGVLVAVSPDRDAPTPLSGHGRTLRHLSGGAVVVGDAVVGVDDQATAILLDPATDVARWRTSLRGDAGPEPLCTQVSAHDGVVVMTCFVLRAPPARNTHAYQVIALDASSGAVLWRHVAEGLLHASGMGGGRVYVLDQSGTLTARGLRDGVVAWSLTRQRGSVNDMFAVAGDRLAWAGPTGPLRFLDTATGRLLQSVNLPGMATRWHPMTLDGNDLYVSLHRGRGGDEESIRDVLLVAVDMRDGRIRWQTDPLPSPEFPNSPAPVVEPEAVHFCGPDGVVRSYARASGELRTWVGVGGCVRLAAVPHAATNAHALAVNTDGTHVTWLTRGERDLAAPERATIEGVMRVNQEVAANNVVLVGDQVARTDAAGRFRATVEGRGTVLVQHVFSDDRENVARVRLDGRSGPYEVRLDVELPGGE